MIYFNYVGSNNTAKTRGAYYWSNSFGRQHIDNQILHCLQIKKLEIAEPG